MSKGIVYFGNQLGEAFTDDEIRTAKLEEGIKAISEIKDLKINTTLSSFCAAVVEGQEEVIQELQELLRNTVDLGAYAESSSEKPMFRVAR